MAVKIVKVSICDICECEVKEHESLTSVELPYKDYNDKKLKIGRFELCPKCSRNYTALVLEHIWNGGSYKRPDWAEEGSTAEKEYTDDRLPMEEAF